MDFCKISLENSGMYTIPISELIKKRKLNHHLYAGDTQTYVGLTTSTHLLTGLLTVGLTFRYGWSETS